MEPEAGFADRNALPGCRAKMHLDASLGLVITHHVLESSEIKISAQLSVDAREQILVERGGNAGRVVIGQPQLRDGLFKISRKQQLVSFAQNRAFFAQEWIARRPVEISDAAAKEKY